jgi:hypothetical protein
MTRPYHIDDLMLAPSQARIAPLTEELATKEAIHGTRKRLLDHHCPRVLIVPILPQSATDCKPFSRPSVNQLGDCDPSISRSHRSASI